MKQYATLVGIKIELNEQGHLPGCVCPDCPTYDKVMNEFLKDLDD